MSSGALAGATIVFDLDGTLVDSAPDLLRALNRTLDLEGLPQLSLSAARRLIGDGARALLERASTLAGAQYTTTKLDELTQAFIAFYRADIASLTLPYPGLVGALDALADAGATLAVCTNKRTDLSVQLLRALGLEARFAAIIGAESTPNRKPHPDHYRLAVERAGGQVGQSLMVGDTAADVAAARGAGAPVIVVRFGYAREDVEQLGADALLDQYADLYAACLRLWSIRS